MCCRLPVVKGEEDECLVNAAAVTQEWITIGFLVSQESKHSIVLFTRGRPLDI